ncbi:DUF4389 domain-containing protein [Aeromicrobium sp.]|uniref:DUF4389 domain-containing protein n=1 Tax=Aeromicrobium sp. TaxID=1871063 RepID=UPI003D6BF32A
MTETPAPPPPPPPPPNAQGDYPVTLTFDSPETIARWRPLVHWLLAIPHLLILSVIQQVAQILAFIAWFAALFTGRIPGGLQKPIAMYLRYNARVTTYLLFQREEYPPFAFDIPFADPGDDARVRVDVAPAVENRNRLTIFFRLFMAIPQLLVLVFVWIAAVVVVIIGWFAVIILGRWPTGLNDFLIGVLRWSTRVSAYLYLLTDEYPPFSLS